MMAMIPPIDAARCVYVTDGRGRCFNVEGVDVSGYCPIHKPGCSDAWNNLMNNLSDYPVHRIVSAMDNIVRGERTRAPETHYKGPFAFTLTMSPKDGLTEEDLVSAVRKVMSQQSCPVSKYAWYLEYGNKETKEHPHIHGMYETFSGGRIEKKYWKRAWKIWDERTALGAGFRGGYHRPVRSEERYSDYIKKDGGLSDWLRCEPQTFSFLDSIDAPRS